METPNRRGRRLCRVAMCRKCRKTTWAGCGRHVKQVMAHEPRRERCSCDPRVPKWHSGEGGFVSRLSRASLPGDAAANGLTYTPRGIIV